MGKKGSWFSAIKRVFTPHSKEKSANEPEKKRTKDKTKTKKKKGWHGDNTSFLQLFKEPSSIEKILDEAERDHNLVFQPPTPQEQPNTPSFVSPRPASPRIPSPRVSSPRATSSRREPGSRPEPTLRYRNAVVTKIQAAYRGYAARKSFRALKGLVRLQSVIRGHSVQKQTANAMKQMQLLVRVQSQIRLRRIQMLEYQMRNQQPQYQNDKQVDTTFAKWTMSQTTTAEASNNQDWDDSLLTKEEVDERLRRKAEAIAKREKAMAYAYSNQSWRRSPNSMENPLAGVQSGGYPLWWNWIEHHLPTTRENTNNFKLTPPRAKSELKPTPRPGSSSSTSKKHQFGLDNSTPRSTKSTIIPSTRQMRTPPSYRFSQNLPMKDDDSLTSCPPFSAPSYMGVTVSAKAKVKAGGSGMMETSESSSRRASFPLSGGGGGGGMGSFKWNKFFSKDSSPSTASARIFDKNHYSVQSVGNMSVDSTASMPVGIGRKPFNRFV